MADLPAADGGWLQAGPRQGPMVSLPDLVPLLKRFLWTIAACPLVTVAIALLYVAMTPASYVASTQLMIEPAKQQLLWQNSNMVDLTVDNAQVESQVEVIRSERIASDVIATLQLADDPEFRSSSGSDYERQRVALARFMDALSTRRVGQSYVIEISFRSRDPEKSARIANAVTAAYIHDQVRAKTDVAQQASQWMQDRVTELGVKLNAAAAAVQKFRAANGIVDTGPNSQTRLIDKLTELEARAEAYRKLYESIVQRLTENEQQESYPVSNVRVIAAASIPLVRSYPKTKLILSLALLLGLLGGGAIAAVRAMLDGRVRTAGHIRDAAGLDCLASLPLLADGRVKEPLAAAYRQVIDAPFSPFTEAMRHVKVSLQAARPNQPRLRLGLVSLMAGEGKSTIAASLAAVFAASGSPTLLIDGDFREASLSRWLMPEAKRGLVEALTDDPDSAIVYDRTTKVQFLPLAGGGRIVGSADLLASPAMERLLRHLDQSFATIIVDLPALSNAVDARAIGPLLDGCILVAEWGRAPVEALTDTVALLQAGQVKLLGAVINKVQEGVPPLFGLHLADLRGLLQSVYDVPVIHAGSR